jgi:ribosome-interacting GTPase 1
MNESAVFTKLDLKWGYHQIELESKSREITTFVTHMGLFRYKRLMFGITSAPELYQHIIQQVLQGCDGAYNISDDIVVHGQSMEEHDARLNKVMERLREKGLTLNPDKCQFRIPKIEFMGHVLSEKGIAPTEAKVKAVRSKGTSNSIRSQKFLGIS